MLEIEKNTEKDNNQIETGILVIKPPAIILKYISMKELINQLIHISSRRMYKFERTK